MGMGRHRNHCGLDWNGFGSVRVQMEGSKAVACLPIGAALERLRNDGHLKKEGEDSGFPSPVQIADLLMALDTTTLKESSWAAVMCTGMLTAGSALYLPPGYIVVERSLASQGHRWMRVCLPCTVQQASMIDQFCKLVDLPPAGAEPQQDSYQDMRASGLSR